MAILVLKKKPKNANVAKIKTHSFKMTFLVRVLGIKISTTYK